MKVFWPKCMYFWYYLQFLLYTMKLFLAKIAKKKKFCQNYVYLVEHTLIHSSQRTVVHIHVNVFL